MAHDIFLAYKNVYQFTCTNHSAPDETGLPVSPELCLQYEKSFWRLQFGGGS